MGLPERIYYRLEEAVTYLNKNNHECTVDDLLHYAATGDLDLLVFVDGRWKSSGICDVDNSECSIFEPAYNGGESSDIQAMCDIDRVGVDKYGFYRDKLRSIGIHELDKGNDNFPFSTYIISVTGLMAFRAINDRRSFYHRLSRDKEVDFSSVLIFAPQIEASAQDDNTRTAFDNWINYHFVISFTSKTINYSDIYIAKSELLYLTDENKKDKENIPHQAISQLIHDHEDLDIPPPKKANSMILLIGALIAALSPKTLDKPYSSDLERVLARKNIKMPLDKATVAKYISEYKNSKNN
ncbi:hypothetical protein [Providencia manganoxydans]|uniref:hypothetical protein n=1 Tax=Providencia manganoxydans TaxID=2923283 RepID=UPI0034DDC229